MSPPYSVLKYANQMPTMLPGVRPGTAIGRITNGEYHAEFAWYTSIRSFYNNLVVQLFNIFLQDCIYCPIP